MPAKAKWSTNVNKERATTYINEERGSIFILFVFMIGIAVAIVAMVVDHSRKSLSLSNLQRVSDIAALTAVKRFNGRKEGWWDAKRAVVLALKSNSVYGAGRGLNDLVLNQGPISAFPDPNSDDEHTIGVDNNVRVTVQRGVYWWDHTLSSGRTDGYGNVIPGGYRFVNLEDKAEWNGVPSYLYANAVRVRVELASLSSSAFGAFTGTKEYKNLVRVSQAVANQQLEVPIFPGGIPYCQLLLNAAEYSKTAPLETEEYIAEEQCQRDLIFTEARPKGLLRYPPNNPPSPGATGGTIDRREGLTRFESFTQRPLVDYAGAGGRCFDEPFTGRYYSCMHLPIYATLGVPSPVPGASASATDIVNAFDPNKPATTARLGMFFAPLERIDTFTPAHRAKISDWIKSGSGTIRSSFTRPGDGKPFYWLPKKNFPLVKSFRAGCRTSGNNDVDRHGRPCFYYRETGAVDEGSSLRVTMKTDRKIIGLDGQAHNSVQKYNMDRQESTNPKFTRVEDPNGDEFAVYSNPMCHDPSLPFDRLDAPVKRTLVAVLAPGKEGVSYCDFENLFAGEEQDSYPPIAATNPKIIGYVFANFYDFGLLHIDATFPPPNGAITLNYPGLPPIDALETSTPVYVDPSDTTRVLTDRNPGELDVKGTPIFQNLSDKTKEYKEEHKNFVDSCPKGGDPNGEGKKCGKKPEQKLDFNHPAITEFARCFDMSPILAHPKYGNVYKNLDDINPSQCRHLIPAADATEQDRTIYYECLEDVDRKKAQEMYNLLETFWENNIKALDATHCLPITKADCFDKNSAECYEELHSLKANYGCGGLAARLSCESTQGQRNYYNWATGTFWQDSKPALVEDDE
jgi:hypothetical protein